MTPQSTTRAETAAAGSVDADSARFDVREFARTARGNHSAELNLDSIAHDSIGADAVRLIRIMRDLERKTMHRMRNLLVTATHKDARVTAFLTTWAFEKFWIAAALDAVLEAAGSDLSTDAGTAPRRTLSERADRRGPVRRAIAGNFAGAQLVAAHVTTGLADEWITSAAYRRIGELASVLGSVVDLVLDIKERHIRFLAEETQRRLAESTRAQRLTRRTIKQIVWPVGAVEQPDSERTFFETVVFGSPEGRAEATRISSLIAALPGLAPVAPTIAARLTP
jgi:hypothetical protein